MEPASPPPDPLAVIEADQFCDCGYNLHGQRVERDERLGFVVVRCPECGKWHPAGHGSTATRVWLNRLAAILLTGWVLLLLGIGGATALASFGLTMGHLEAFTAPVHYEPGTNRLVIENRDWNNANRESRYSYVYVDTREPVPLPTDPAIQVDTDAERHYPRRQVSVYAVPEDAFIWGRRPPAFLTFWFVLGMAIPGLVLGVFQSATLWHVRWPWKLAPPLLVVAAAVGLVGSTLIDTSFTGLVTATLARSVGTVPGTLLIAWIVGLLIGRPVARVIVRSFVPPKPRQALAHLWLADGKAMP
jgi:hypothetical protein